MDIEEIKRLIKPGDVILLDGKSKWWQLWLKIIHWGIRFYQRRLFGKESNYRDTHATLYFAPEMVFSCTFPAVQWETLEHQLKQRFSVYRYSGIEYSNKHVRWMGNVAYQLIGRDYDVGDLLDFFVGGILGYDHVRKVRWFEFSKKKLVCATAVRTIQEKLRKYLEADGDTSIPRLFNRLNLCYWSIKEALAFKRTDVEMTTPAHYANSRWFAGEFKLMCDWKDLKGGE